MEILFICVRKESKPKSLAISLLILRFFFVKVFLLLLLFPNIFWAKKKRALSCCRVMEATWAPKSVFFFTQKKTRSHLEPSGTLRAERGTAQVGREQKEKEKENGNLHVDIYTHSLSTHARTLEKNLLVVSSSSSFYFHNIKERKTKLHTATPQQRASRWSSPGLFASL